MDFLKFASERYSVRKFENKNLDKETVEKILKAGHIAPTGCNKQPQRILVLNTPDSTAKLKKCTNSHFDAPTAIIVCYNKDESWVRRFDGALCAPVDASIVTTHMMLMAHSLGVGSCWVMSFDPKALRDEFNIPENHEPVSILVMGYPHKDSIPSPMHETVRPIEETVFYETF